MNENMLNDEIEDIDSEDEMNQMYQMQAEMLQGHNKFKGPVIPGLSLGGIEGAGYGTKIQVPEVEKKKPIGLSLPISGLKTNQQENQQDS